MAKKTDSAKALPARKRQYCYWDDSIPTQTGILVKDLSSQELFSELALRVELKKGTQLDVQKDEKSGFNLYIRCKYGLNMYLIDVRNFSFQDNQIIEMVKAYRRGLIDRQLLTEIVGFDHPF